jgi:hypothetical protein
LVLVGHRLLKMVQQVITEILVLQVQSAEQVFLYLLLVAVMAAGLLLLVEQVVLLAAPEQAM